MTYCCQKNKPIASLCPMNNAGGELTQIVNCSTWNDQYCMPSKRKAKWYILRGEETLVVFEMATLDTPIPIGIGSTYQSWILSENGEEVFSYLENLGFSFENGDEIQIRVLVENCNCTLSETWSNAVFLIYNCECLNPWQTLDNENWETMTGACWEYFPTSNDPIIARDE